MAHPTAAEPGLRCCSASGCRSAGSEELLEALLRARERAGLSEEALPIRAVGCLRLCGRGPLLAWDGPAGGRLYGNLSPEQAGLVLEGVRGGAAAPADDPLAAQALDLLLILHADHEQNASTSTVRLAGSTGANPYSAISAGVSALWGPAHGGANEAVLEMLEEIGSVDNIPKFLAQVKDKASNVRLMGFGHRVYKNFDPRAKIIREMCHKVLAKMGRADNPLLELAQRLEEIALKDEYFVSRKLYPNVDFYSGIIYSALGIPRSMFTVMFAIARTAGWVAHWQEMISDPGMKIGRPRQLYTGPVKREYTPIGKR